MVTGAKSKSPVASPSSSYESPSKLNAPSMHSAPTSTTTTVSAVTNDSHFQDVKEKSRHDYDAVEKKIAEEKELHNFDAMEKKITEETVLHDTMDTMYTPPSPSSSLSETEREEVNKICSIKKHLKENMGA
eukprot:15066658-Ditylum_brightwellii.AAC.1